MIKPYLVMSCPASSRSGYGDHSRDLIRSLIEMDLFEIHIIDQMWGHCPQNALSADDPIQSLLLRKNMEAQPDVWIQVTVPGEFQPIGKYNIGITAGIETTLASSLWLEGCNRMHKIIVPSEHSKYILQKSYYDKKDQQGNTVEQLKLTTSIDVLFEGLNLDVFNKTKVIEKDIKKSLDSIKEDFCFLACGHWLNGVQGEDRKDMGQTIKTFLETFKDKKTDNMPALILKASSATFSITDREDMLNRIETIKKQVTSSKKLPSIYLIHGDLTEEQMNGLYNHSKVKAMVSFTKGEGFGRPLLEFSNTGKPTLASNWSGQIDFLAAYGILLPGQLKNVHQSVVWENTILKESQWFTVDYGFASGILKDVHKNYKKHLEKSRKQTQYIKENFSLNEMGRQFKVIMQDVLDETYSTLKPKLDDKSLANKNKQLEELQTYE